MPSKGIRAYFEIDDAGREAERERRLRGAELRVLGAFLLLSGAVAGGLLSFVFPLNLIPAALLFGTASKVIDDGRRLGSPSAAAALSRDPRPPLLFLRAFVDDGSFSRPNWLLTTMLSLVPIGYANRRLSHEEELVRVIKHLGPVVAVGRPGERLPGLGAARLYLPHEQWQAGVKALMDRSQLVILRIWQGVLWELRTAIELVAPERLVIYAEPPVLPSRVTELIPADLPAGCHRFLYFDPDWTPSVAPSM
ncbi:MAG TPA: hypothetical protein VF170_03035 [Planctomycetaceae bacterium]